VTRPKLIGIAGPSGSGKSELARRLAFEWQSPVISLDAYYRDLAHLPTDRRALTNFDDPGSIDSDLLFADLEKLAGRQPIAVPRYDFATHTRTAGFDAVAPSPVVLIEGLFTLYWRQLRDLLHLKIYVHLEDSLCLERRRRRDVAERGRTAESVDQQYAATVRPMAEQYIWPTKHHADVVIGGDAALDQSVALLAARILISD
jgi:uridine kinase